MALPTTIVSTGQAAGYSPPFKSSGSNFYSVVQDGANDRLHVYKATDPTDSWTVQDDSNRPTSLDASYILSLVQSGDVIHMVTQATSDGDLNYHTFNMATDAWVIIDESIETPNDAPTVSWVSVAIRSDGDVVIAYSGDTDQNMGGKKERVDYARREGGSWTVGIALDAGGDIHYGNPNIAKASTTDDMHIYYGAEADPADPPIAWGRYEAISIDEDNNLSTTDTFNNNNTSLLGITNLVTWEDGSTQRAGAYLVASTVNDDPKFLNGDDSGTGSANITSLRTITSTSSLEASQNGEISIGSTVVLDNELHILYSGGGTSGVDKDIHYTTSTDDAITWSTPTEELDGVTCNFISANIYVRGTNTVLAYVYDDGGVTKYNEKILIEGGLNLSPTGIGTSESIGSHTLTTGSVDISATGIASEESIGSHTVAAPLPEQDLQPTSIGSAESHGSHTIGVGSVDISTTGIPSTESIGSHVLTTGSVNISVTGISSGESVGTHTISTGAVDLSPSAIASLESFGSHTLSTGAVDISLTGISTSESFGSATISQDGGEQFLTLTGISSSESIGSHVLSTNYSITATGIPTGEGVGSHTLDTTYSVVATGVPSEESIGSATLTTGSVGISTTGIPSLESFGTPIIVEGAVTLSPSSIGSEEAIGSATITVGEVDVSPSSITSEESFGSASVSIVFNLQPTGISTSEAHGTPSVSTGVVDVSPTGIVSGEVIGSAVLSTTVDTAPTGIGSSEGFGSPTISISGLQGITLTGIPSAESIGSHAVTFGGTKEVQIDNQDQIVLDVNTGVLIYFNGGDYYTI